MFDFQFPYFLTEEINRRITEGAKGSIRDEDLILERIRDFLGSKQRLNMIEGENYYIGSHDILRRKRTAIGEGGQLKTVDNLPNNRIVDNQYKKLVDQKVNYIVGKPITFNSGNKKYAQYVKDILDADFMHSLKNVVKDCLNCGIGWMFVNYDQRGRVVFKRLKPWEIAAVWKDNEHTSLDHAIRFYDVSVWKGRKKENVRKVEIFDKEGISRFYIDRGRLVPDGEDFYSPYFFVGKKGVSWEEIPLIAFKYNDGELPLIRSVKSLQDGLNVMISNFQNAMEEDVRNTILVLKNYDGEDLGEFRRNLAAYGAVKVRTEDGSQGGVETLNIQVNDDNYNAIINILKKAIIENAMGYDAKDDRLMGQPNQMNIMSMYSDIDLDANGMEMEFQRAFKALLYFVDCHLSNIGRGSFFSEKKEIIFNRDVLINESDVIDNCVKSLSILSEESVVSQHPWVEDVDMEMKRLKGEREASLYEGKRESINNSSLKRSYEEIPRKKA